MILKTEPLPAGSGAGELLAILDQVITYDIPLLILNDHEIDPELVPAFRTWAENQAEKIKDGLSCKMISDLDERAFEKCIQGYQRDIFRLAGLLLNYAEPEDLNAKLPTESVASLVQTIFMTLQDVLNFIEKRFSKYFDQDSWIPSDFKRIVKPEIARDVDTLRADLLVSGCMPVLVDIAMQPIYRFVSRASNNDTNYRTILYVKELKANLATVSNGTGDPNARLIKDTLYYLNFNCPDFLRYQIKTLGLLRDTCTDQEMVRELNRFRKELNQAQTKPSFGLYPNQPSLKAQLNDWIQEELNFISFQETETPKEASVKMGILKTDLTVPQLAYLIWLLVQHCVIQIPARQATTFFKAVAAVFKTGSNASISSDSLSNKYYTPDPTVYLAIKILLQKMLKSIEVDEAKAFK